MCERERERGGLEGVMRLVEKGYFIYLFIIHFTILLMVQMELFPWEMLKLRLKRNDLLAIDKSVMKSPTNFCLFVCCI